MAGLMLKFPTGERISINGAVIENVGRAARLRLLTPGTQLLRLRDAIDPREADTPVGRLCHALQMVLVGEGDAVALRRETMAALLPLRQAFVDGLDRACIDEIGAHLQEARDYQALRALSRLRQREAAILQRYSA